MYQSYQTRLFVHEGEERVQVARELVHLHAELMTGCQATLNRLLQAPAPTCAPGYRAPQVVTHAPPGVVPT
jgi:hypothetical protein